ncbi:MAG: P-II family nitrogen regulator [Clostridia bacterium]|nr:P-II family nitrogen regulator [Clostridia bacterium]
MNNYEMVLCIVDAGFSELVMDAAKEEGARGGTVIHARGTANKEAEQFFHIAIQPDKDIVLILVPADIKDNVLHAIYRNAGLKSEGKGIAFSIAVDEVVGISSPSASPATPNEDGKVDEKKADKKENNSKNTKEKK